MQPTLVETPLFKSSIKNLLIDPSIDNFKIRISPDAKHIFMRYVNDHIKMGIQDLIEDGLPRATKGNQKGSALRTQLQQKDFAKFGITEPFTEDCTSQYVNVSKIKPFLIEPDYENALPVTIHKPAKCSFNKYLDRIVENAVQRQIDQLPRSYKHPEIYGKKGQLKRITIISEDFR